jgi:hypothetical protein
MQRRRALLHSLTFALLIGLPFLGLLAGVNDQEQLGERRRLADWPGAPEVAALPDYPARFERWFDDHFGFRSLLIRSNKEIEWRVKRTQVEMVVGSNGWLFLGAPSRIDRYRCVEVPDAAAWGALASERGAQLADLDVPLYWVIAPNKHTVHAEALPSERAGAERPCDLAAATSVIERPNVEVVDLRAPLREERGEHPWFHKTDTHWNMLGAARGAELALARVRERFPALPHIPLDAFEVQIEPDAPGGDIAVTVQVYGEVYTEDLLTLVPRRPLRARPAEGGPELEPSVHSRKEQRLVMETGRAELPSAMVFHDSFGYPLMPYLSEHFERVVYLHTTGAIDFAAIRAESPDLVLLIQQEKKLAFAPYEDTGHPQVARAAKRH